mgnify:CR=1 FL=1
MLELEEKLIMRRRHLHRVPELSGKETKTMQYVCTELDKIGVPYQAGIAGNGIIAEIGSATLDSRVLAIRADMDALPITEETNLPYASNFNGIMHACGHDAHTAILLTVCEYLQKNRKQLKGKVKFFFQPLEETSGGAEPMISAGALENPTVDACIALHVDPELECGKIRIKEGNVYASPDDFEITVYGKSGHGAQPELCIDPILVAAHIITALQSITSRRLSPFDSAVITIGAIHGGTCSNAIPGHVTMIGTARSATNEIRCMLEKEIEKIVRGICESFGATYNYRFIRLFPPLINNAKIAHQIYNSAKLIVGNENAIWGGNSTMAGEDFSYFTQKVPGAIFKLGCRNEKSGITAPLHNSKFQVDEACLKFGAAIFADFALNFLNQSNNEEQNKTI